MLKGSLNYFYFEKYEKEAKKFAISVQLTQQQLKFSIFLANLSLLLHRIFGVYHRSDFHKASVTQLALAVSAKVKSILVTCEQ